MAEYTPSRLVEHEISKRIIVRDPTGLLPDRLAGWWCNTADNNVPNLALSVTADGVNSFTTSHFHVQIDSNRIDPASINGLSRNLRVY